MNFVFQLENINSAAAQFWGDYSGSKVFAFYGEMGAGKTTFINALCAQKGVTGKTGSPTFSIINEYRYPGGNLFHIDLYRLKDEEEAVRAGVEECLYSGAYCFVEWPARAPGIFPPDTIPVFIEMAGTHSRKLRIGEPA